MLQPEINNSQEPVLTAEKQKPGIPRFVRIIGNIVGSLIILLAVLTLFFLAQYKITGGPPKFAGHQLYIVLSGSMEPTFGAGSLVFVRPTSPEMIKESDIITFGGQGKQSALTTHRVMQIEKDAAGKISFVTKGDANDVLDPNPVPATRLVGKVNLAIPYMGTLMDFARTKYGLLVFVIIPGLLLITMEAFKLYNNMARMNKQKKAEKMRSQI